MTIIVALPGEGSSQEIVSVSHEINFQLRFECLLEYLFFSRVCRIKNEVIDVRANVYVVASGSRCGVTVDYPREETWVMDRLGQAHVLKCCREHVVPVVGGAPEAIEKFVE